MLKSLRLLQWKSYTDATLFFDPITVLIGANASGKSNAIDALRCLQRLASGMTVNLALGGGAFVPPLRGGLAWASLRGGGEAALEAVIALDSHQELRYRIAFTVTPSRARIAAENALIRREIPQKRGKVQVTEQALFATEVVGEEQLAVTVERERRPLAAQRSTAVAVQLSRQSLPDPIAQPLQQLLATLTQFFVLEPQVAAMRGFSPLEEQLASDAHNLAGFIAAQPRDAQAVLTQQLTEFAQALPGQPLRRVYAETVGKLGSDAMLYCDEVWPDDTITVVDARAMSDGTLRFLATLTALLTRPRGSLLALEEVDNGLHPARLALLLRAIDELGAQRGVDVLMTTHNPGLLDALGPAMAPFVVVAHRPAGGGATALAVLDEVKRLHGLLDELPMGQLVGAGAVEAALNADAKAVDLGKTPR